MKFGHFFERHKNEIVSGAAALASLSNVEAQDMRSAPIDKVISKTDISVDNNLQDKRLDSDKTFMAGASDFIASATRLKDNNPSLEKTPEPAKVEKSSVESAGEELARIDFKINFVVDKADIPSDQEKKVAEQFSAFLKNITPHNFKQAMAADWNVVSGCSEEATKSWGPEGNKKLADNRGGMTVNILDKTQKSFSNPALSAEQNKAIQDKIINVKVVLEHPENPGVTYVTDLKKADGTKYSPEEVEKMKKEDPKTFEKLKESNRVAAFSAELSKDKMAEMESVTPEKIVKMASKNDRWIIGMDNSNSMKSDYYALKDQVVKGTDTLKNTKTFIVNFSEKLGKLNKFDAKKMDQNFFNENLGGSNERTIQNIKLTLANLPVEKNGHTVLTFHTDEPLQQFYKYDLDDIKGMVEASKKQMNETVDIHLFCRVPVAGTKDTKIIDLSLDDVINGVNKEIKLLEAKDGKINYRDRNANPKPINWSPEKNWKILP